MSDSPQDPAPDELLEEVRALRRELAQRRADDAQRRLLGAHREGPA